MTGFLDGINDSLKEKNPIEEMEEDTPVNLGFDKELLYKNMVDAKADWLYEPAWDEIFTPERKKSLSGAEEIRHDCERPRWAEMIPAPAEAERNINTAAEDRRR